MENNEELKLSNNVQEMEQYLLNSNQEKLFNNLIKENKNTLFEDIKYKMTNALDEIAPIMEKIKNNQLDQVSGQASKHLNNISQLLEYIADIYDSGIPFGLEHLYQQLSSKYRKLEYQLFNQEFERMKKHNNKINQNINNQSKKLKEQIKKNETLKQKQEELSNEIFSKIESIGATTLNMILTISLVSASVAIFEKIENIKYIPMFILSVVWILFTCIIFNASTFKARIQKKEKLDYNQILCIITYSLLSLGTLICILVTCL